MYGQNKSFIETLIVTVNIVLIHTKLKLLLQYKYLDIKGKGKIVPVLFLNRAPRHEGVLGEWRYISTLSFTSALDGGAWSAPRSGRFATRERAPGTHWIGG
jgi:hypothetical protein